MILESVFKTPIIYSRNFNRCPTIICVLSNNKQETYQQLIILIFQVYSKRFEIESIENSLISKVSHYMQLNNARGNVLVQHSRNLQRRLNNRRNVNFAEVPPEALIRASM